MFCRIYLSGRIIDSLELLVSISELTLSDLVENQYVEKELFSCEIRSNDEFDEAKQKAFPDGFLFFPFSIEVDFQDSADIYSATEVVTKILEYLWANNYTAIASCEFEDQLPEKGGYRSKNIPWFN